MQVGQTFRKNIAAGSAAQVNERDRLHANNVYLLCFSDPETGEQLQGIYCRCIFFFIFFLFPNTVQVTRVFLGT